MYPRLFLAIVTGPVLQTFSDPINRTGVQQPCHVGATIVCFDFQLRRLQKIVVSTSTLRQTTLGEFGKWFGDIEVVGYETQVSVRL